MHFACRGSSSLDASPSGFVWSATGSVPIGKHRVANRAVHREEFVLHGAITGLHGPTSVRTVGAYPLGIAVRGAARGASLGRFGIPPEPTSMLPRGGFLALFGGALSGHLWLVQDASIGRDALGEASIALIRLNRFSTSPSLSRSLLWMRKAGAPRPIGGRRGSDESHKRRKEGGSKSRVWVPRP